VQEFQARTGIRCELRIDGSDEAIDADRSTAVFRILQEALTNISRHAEANLALVTFARQDGLIRLEVRDDGRGISPKEVADPRSLGLIGMRERVLPWGGRVNLGNGAPGAVLTVIVPLSPEHSDAAQSMPGGVVQLATPTESGPLPLPKS
jgi:signal transduction histidine kinase